jgi:hypothetical protein
MLFSLFWKIYHPTYEYRIVATTIVIKTTAKSPINNDRFADTVSYISSTLLLALVTILLLVKTSNILLVSVE